MKSNVKLTVDDYHSSYVIRHTACARTLLQCSVGGSMYAAAPVHIYYRYYMRVRVHKSLYWYKYLVVYIQITARTTHSTSDILQYYVALVFGSSNMFQCEHTQNECVYTQRPSECEHTQFECVHTRWAPGKATVDHVYQSAIFESTCYLTKVIGECATLTHSLIMLGKVVWGGGNPPEVWSVESGIYWHKRPRITAGLRVSLSVTCDL